MTNRRLTSHLSIPTLAALVFLAATPAPGTDNRGSRPLPSKSAPIFPRHRFDPKF